MNTPSPAPHRRRRAMQPEADDISLTNAAPEDDSAPQPSPPMRRRAAQQAPSAQRSRSGGQPLPRKRAAAAQARSPFEGTFLEQIPLALRIALIAVCVVIFCGCAFAITRNYMLEQEQRRRLEAEAAERAQHPLEYADLIVEYALAQNLDPALVSAVILCESSYNPLAESRLGARGLMQLMEDTAGWVAHKLDEDDASYSFDLLYDPETNIRYGTWYLGYLSRRFGGDATKIVCAYHAGQGNVDSWLKNPEYSSDGVTLDTIPTQDTATYASRVLRARDVYRKHYFSAPAESGVNP
ncbi:MAG: lytic transglycosylase domain-containing protein [Clostridia bacterium]|nr:lytic transglycosylase domain-containing protein [Clostridia bacterium]